MTPAQQAVELKNFKEKTFIRIGLYETHKAQLGIYGDFYAVRYNYWKDSDTTGIKKNVIEIKTFGNAKNAVEFYNKNNR